MPRYIIPIIFIVVIALSSCVYPAAPSQPIMNQPQLTVLPTEAILATISTPSSDSYIREVVTRVPWTSYKAELHNDWLKQNPCLAPCWHGVIPGVTSPKEMMSLLEEDSSIYYIENKISPLFLDSGWVLWEGEYSSGEASYNPESTSEVIENVLLNNLQPIGLRDVLAVYGEPTHVIIDASPDEHGDGNVYGLWLIYMDQGFALLYNNSTPTSFINIEREMSFQYVLFFAQGEALAKFMSGGTSEVISPGLTTWEGFKSFAEYCIEAYENDATWRCPESALLP